MNPYQRQSIINKTGVDPIKPKITSPKEYALYYTRNNQLVIKGTMALCKWKQRQERQLNPLSPTIIKLYTGQ